MAIDSTSVKSILANPFIDGEQIYLRPLTEEDASGNYPHWFNDADVCRGNSHHVYPYTQQQALDFIKSLPTRNDMLVLAIVSKISETHVGNISLQNINRINRCAEFAIIIGEKSAWGKGVGKEAARLVISHGFLSLNLHRIECGTFENNFSMQKIALSIGMRLEGTRRKKAYKDGNYYDVLEYGMLREEFLEGIAER